MYTSIIIYILAFTVVLILIWILVTNRRMKKFFLGTKAQDLEQVLMTVSKQMSELKETQNKINSHLVEVDERLSKSIRNIEMVRFNPFEESGSKQSFAVAMLNDEGDGVVMSSLYARDRMSIFAKQISKGKSDIELSTEEKEVVDKAK